jgi:methylmalonyl-CoA epimerase
MRVVLVLFFMLIVTTFHRGRYQVASLNHIGIAVRDLAAIKKLFSLLDLDVSHSEPVIEQGVNTHFLPLPAVQSHLELLEVTDPNGTVSQFLKKRGPGIHHLAFALKQGELDALCKRLRSAGFRLIYDEPKQGAHKMRINFIHPSSSGGILIELMEPG